jgi:sterol desaturase/sphingolipid hydroxylase (fatty acid hydroxylase superfamily)
MPALTQRHALILVLAVLGTLFVLEQVFPLRKRARLLWPRLIVNACLSLATYAVAAALVRPTAFAVLGWTAGRSFGLLRLFALPRPLELLLGFLLLDLSFYYWHRLNHRAPFLWRFHNVHHVDPDLDASTAFRFHFGEVALSAGFRAVQVAAIGPALSTFLLYELVFQIETYFHHSNLRLPLAFERPLNFLLVTPRMHGIHHSQFHAETDSNYSVVFSVWDRLHRTYRWGISQDEIAIGVPGYSAPEDNRVLTALLLPFQRQRDYWRGRESRADPA